MLWRLKPIFHQNLEGAWKYDHVLCRDTDSIPTYREAQAVAKWIQEDTCMHSITDSVSHTIPLMGGMIGIRPRYFSEIMEANSWHDLMGRSLKGGSNGVPNHAKGSLTKYFRQYGECTYNFNQKGTDQEFLNAYCWPRVSRHDAPNFTAHWIKGLTGGNANRQYNYIQDIDLGHPEYKELNYCAGHIGSAGFYDVALMNFLKTDPNKEKYAEIEMKFPKLFYWHL
jgi:hypothetical protein